MSVWAPTADGILLGRVEPVEHADVAVFPFEVGATIRTEEDRTELRHLVAANARAGLRTVLVLDHDHAKPVDLGQPDSAVLRTSMIASYAYTEEYAMPAWAADPWAGAAATARPWAARPTVGFMGRVNPGAMHRMSGYSEGDPVPFGFARTDPRSGTLFPEPVDIGAALRRKALAGVERSPLVDARIVVRDAFFGHYDPGKRELLRGEYAEHLAGSDYVLCVRGFGNYSIRLFETMAMGRVPVIVESDLVLPCADVVDWDAIAVRVPYQDIDHVAEHVAAAHAEGPLRFERRQREARAAWIDWLCVDGFARYVADVILAGVARG